MRITTLMLVFCAAPFFGLGQNTIRGNVVDELGLPIYLASVEVQETTDITYTDFDGSFSLTSQKDFHWKINIKSQGYNTESFFVLSGGSTGELVLEYSAEMKALLDGNSSLHNKFYWKPWYEGTIFQKSEVQLTSNFMSGSFSFGLE
ncbi:carboxypeptidase-like regulatory domain-containing protein [uncultured Croceitalea sp.]|uniref:carboxypeptidase-like regulatory domain-containing protein n=1 Tax=uncultured Croceitalea sp. TaxID=1798908 RepID=UPI0033063E5A